MSHQDQVLKSYCTTREASKRLGVSLRTAQLWVEQGILEAWKTHGGHRRICRTSVENLVSKREQNPPGIAAGAPFEILIVEDDDALRTLYLAQARLWPMKLHLRSARNGYDALIQMGQHAPDLLITDLLMPGMDGFEMLHTLPTIPSLTFMSILVVTGLDPQEVAQHPKFPKGVPILPKPVPFDQIQDHAHRCRISKTRDFPGVHPLSQVR
ncbi:response regulator receiver protein [mine drainage metagenome]|uniref:Response regulator receiver protein n=1 Tax=mine drainage metagenome TaxID=410659 RepID=T1D6S0_9ZZZZ